MYLWRAVDDEGEVLDSAMQPGRDAWTAAKFLAKLISDQPVFPHSIVTDQLPSYADAARRLKIGDLHRHGRWRENNRVENSHLPIRRRERKMQKFKSQESAQRFLSTHAAVYNTFYTQPHLIRRSILRQVRREAFIAWSKASAA
jgi:transposase-like protein